MREEHLKYAKLKQLNSYKDLHLNVTSIRGASLGRTVPKKQESVENLDIRVNIFFIIIVVTIICLPTLKASVLPWEPRFFPLNLIYIISIFEIRFVSRVQI